MNSEAARFVMNIDELDFIDNTVSDAADVLLLNSKCKAGTFDDSNKCGPEKENNKNIKPVISKVTKKDLEIVSKDISDDYEFLHNDFNKTKITGYTLKNGLNIIYPLNPKVRNLLPMEDLLEDLKGLPKALVNSVEQIEIADMQSPENRHDEAEMSGRILTLWAPSRLRITADNLGNTGLIAHELSHAFDSNPPEWFISKGTSTARNDFYIQDKGMDAISGSIEWENARKADGKPWVTSYAKATGRYNEDFADSVTHYLLRRKTFEKKFPNRAKFIEQLLDERNQNQKTSFQEVSTSFNAELGGFHTTDYKTASDKPLRVISQDKSDNPKLLEAIKDIEPGQLPSQFLVMKMKDGMPAKYYAKTDSIGVDKSLSSSEMSKEIKKVLDSMKTNSSYLENVANFIKLNYKCKHEDSPDGKWRDEEHPAKWELGLNTSYLSEVSDFIKLNYRCEFNGVDYKCGINEDADKIVRNKIKAKIEDVKKSGKSSSASKIQTKNFGGNIFLGMSDISASEEYQELAKEYGIQDMSTLDTAYNLVKGISVGPDMFSGYDQGQVAREHIYDALKKGGDLKKALELKIAVESQEFFGDHSKDRRLIDLKIHAKETLDSIDKMSGTSSNQYISSTWQDVHDEKSFGKISVDLTTPESREAAKQTIQKYFDNRIKEVEKSDSSKSRILYRKGGYHKNTIESYTTSSEGADMAALTNPGEVVLTPDFEKTSDELLKDGWLALAGANEGTGYGGESEVILINIKDILSGDIKRDYDKEAVDATIQKIKDKNEKLRNQYNDINKKIYEDKVVDKLPTSLNINSKPITDIESTKIFKTILESEGKFEKYNRLENPILTTIAQDIGFDKQPTIVSSDQMEELITRGELILYIGYNNTKKFDQFKTGRYIGDNDDLGTSGYKMFDNIDQAITWGSGKNGFIVRAALDKSAKIVDKKDVVDKSRNLVDTYRKERRNEQHKIYEQLKTIKDNKEAQEKVMSQADSSYKKEKAFQDIMGVESVAAIAFGYDAMRDDNNHIFTLNRGAIYVQQNAVPAKDLEELNKVHNRVYSSRSWVESAKEYVKDDPQKVEKLVKYQKELDDEIAKEKELSKTIWKSKQNQNASYLQEAADYLILQDAVETSIPISLNRQGKCPRGTVDDSILLNDAFDFIKLNYNCPDSEKVGSGKGSCSGGKTESNEPKFIVPTLSNGEVDMDARLPDGTYVHNFSEGSDYFRSEEFKSTPSGQLFTERQAHYLREFSGPGSHSINSALTKGKEREIRKYPNDFDARMLKNLDQAMKRSTINRKETLFTGLDFERSTVFDSAEIGQVIPQRRFTSTSREIDQAEKFAEGGYKEGVKINKNILEIEVPSGIHGIDMVPFAEPGSYKQKENEVLLDRGLSFEIVDKYKKDNYNIIKVKVLKE